MHCAALRLGICRCIDILSHALEADSLVPVVDSQCSHPISLGARLIDLCNRLVEQCTQRASETKIARGDANSPVADIRLVVCLIHTHRDGTTCLTTHDS